MPNQYTKAEELGTEKPSGANQFTTGRRTKHDQATIDKIRAERAAQCAESIMDAEDSTKAEKLAAAKLLLPFGKSTLQSVEERQVSEWDQMSPEEMQERVRALITSHPELIKQFTAGLKAVDSVASEQQTQRNIAGSA